jgi:drug/metabolite transporter (DMT)-like permease
VHRRQLADYSLLAVVWGCSFLILVQAVEAFGWVGAVTFRALIAAALLWGIARLSGRRLDFAIGWRPLLVVGATTVAGQLIGLSFAAPRIGSAMSAIFVATIPLFSMVIGQWWGTEHIGPSGRVGLVVGLAGMVLLVGFPAVPVTTSFVIGCIASLLSCISSAFGSNYARLRLRDVGAWEQTIGSFAFGGLLTLPLLVFVPVPRMPSALDVLYLLLLAAVVSSLCYVVYFRLVSEVGATRAISVEFVVTVIAVIAGSVVLDEQLSWVQLIGGTIIILGCAMVLGLLPRTRQVSTARPPEPQPSRR